MVWWNEWNRPDKRQVECGHDKYKWLTVYSTFVSMPFSLAQENFWFCGWYSRNATHTHFFRSLAIIQFIDVCKWQRFVCLCWQTYHICGSKVCAIFSGSKVCSNRTIANSKRQSAQSKDLSGNWLLFEYKFRIESE